MKKRLSVLLAFALAISSVMPANATEAKAIDEVSDNTVVQDIETESSEAPVSDEDSEIKDLTYADENGSEILSSDDIAINKLVEEISFVIKEDKAYIKSYWGILPKFVIPESRKFNDDTVHLIEGLYPEAFKDANALKTVSMSNVIDEVGKNCFIGATSLNKINISEKLTYIPEGCFNYCDSLKKIYIPKAVKTIKSYAFTSSCNTIHDVYYSGSEADWNNISIKSHNEMLEGARIHYNASFSDYEKDNDFSNPPKNDSNKDNSWINYNSVITFSGKKVNAKDFGTITISYNGNEYTASKIKINRKKQLFQITNITPKDKSVRKYLKQLTKGDNGLSYTIKPYEFSSNDTVKVKLDRNNDLKSVKVKLPQKLYRCKKTEYSYDASSKTINFQGGNLSGNYILK